MVQIDKNKFLKVCNESDSMAKACAALGMHFNTFKKYALKFGCYKTNRSGKGTIKNRTPKVDLQEILEGKHPYYQTYKLKKRLIKSGIKKNECEECKLKEWRGKSIEVELDHINGNSKDHRLENLKMLCPNCHSQTDTFRAKNIKS